MLSADRLCDTAGRLLRLCKRHKDGIEPHYWRVEENHRAGTRVVQRQLPYPFQAHGLQVTLRARLKALPPRADAEGGV